MTASRFLNQLKLAAALAADGNVVASIGEISAYDPNTRLVRCILHPAELETGWIPLGNLMVGSGFGVYIGPGLGDCCAVLHVDRNINAGFCLLFMSTDEEVPPAVPSGEIHAIHSSGSFLKFLNDGSIQQHAAAGWIASAEGDISITGNRDISITAANNLNLGATEIQEAGPVEGNSTATYAEDVIAGPDAISAITHPHGGVQTGGGTSGPPLP